MGYTDNIRIMIGAIDEAIDKKYISLDTAQEMRSFCESADITDNDDREVLQEIRDNLISCSKYKTTPVLGIQGNLVQEHSNIDKHSVVEGICESVANGKITVQDQIELLGLLENM